MNLRVSIACVVVFVARSALASVTEFTNKSAWEAAAGVHTTIGFADLPHNTVVTNQYESLGVLFTDGIDLVTFAPSLFPNDDYGLRGVLHSITTEFTEPMYSIAVDFPGCVQFELYNRGQLIHVSQFFCPPTPVGNFAGLLSDQPFDEARIFDPLGGVVIDDLHFGPPIPAPAALGLLGAAAFMMPKRRRRIPRTRRSVHAPQTSTTTGVLMFRTSTK